MQSENELWVPTYSGRKINLLDPDPNDICLEDIAHSLALCNRYLGTSIRPYSVAEHSVRLAHAAGVILPRHAWNVIEAKHDRTSHREALMHDALEAYTWDLPRMIVNYLGSAYAMLQVRMDDAIRHRFGLFPQMSSRLKDLDRAICRVETRSGLFRSPDVFHHLRTDPTFNGVRNDAVEIERALKTFNDGRRWWGTRDGWGWDWQYAERRFLEAAADYGVE